MSENLREKIGRYEILGELGRGAMGVVYKARDPNIDRIVAIKAILRAEFADAPEGEEMQERFRREVQTAGLLTHSNIVTVYDGGIDGDLHWIAMEFIDGPSLKQIITVQSGQTGYLPLAYVRQLALFGTRIYRYTQILKHPQNE